MIPGWMLTDGVYSVQRGKIYTVGKIKHNLMKTYSVSVFDGKRWSVI